MHCLKPFICALGLSALADAQISLGTAGQYGVFAATTITNAGLTIIDALIGVSPGTAITGFPPGLASGENTDNAAAATAKASLETAYSALAALPVTTELSGEDLGGLTLDAGVYGFANSGQLSGILILDGQGNPDAVFVFQFGSTFTTTTLSSVLLINGALPCNVYWQVGSSATFGVGTIFAGAVLAEVSITVNTGVSLVGGFYALSGAVTLDTNIIDPLGNCGGSTVPTSTATSSTVSSTVTSSTVSTTTSSSTVSTTASSSTVSTTASTTPSSSTVSTTTSATVTPPATTTVTITSTVTNPASTTTITVTASTTVTVTQTVATTSTTLTSTTTSYSTVTTTKTASATACPTSHKKPWWPKDKREIREFSPKTKTKTVTATYAGHTLIINPKSSPPTHTVRATCTSTSTEWHTAKSTTTQTFTHTPTCTTHAKARQDYERMFG